MKLFIIGNGFDKGHGLKTDYWDFRIFLNRCYPEFLYKFESKYNIYPGLDNEDKKNILWKEFEKNLANIEEDLIIENALSLDIGLESGDVGIEDTLYDYFSQELEYINKLPYYLKLWIQSISIRDVQVNTNMINAKNKDMYINFNYTGVLENVYKIDKSNITHIHGSLQKYDNDLVIGHGNHDKIEQIEEKINCDRIKQLCKKTTKAEGILDEKEISIFRAIENYYLNTYKDVNLHKHKLWNLINKDIEEVIVIGHSVGEIDMPYFRDINALLGQKPKWYIYYHKKNEKKIIHNNIRKCGVMEKQISMKETSKFYNVIY